MSTATLRASIAFAAFLLAAPAFADAGFPTRPVRIYAASAGGTADFAARYVAQQLAAKWREGVVVENRPGAGGTLSAVPVARSSPDGYNILMGEAASLAIAPGIYPTIEYDPLRSFAPITLVARAPMVITVHPSVKAASLEELLRQARSAPGRLNFSTGGSGTMSHLTTAMLMDLAGARLTHVPYKGVGASVMAIVAGEVQVAAIAASTAAPHIRAGKLRALAVASESRYADLPEIPTTAEAGMPGLLAEAWFGLVAPAGTPGPLVQRIAKDVADVLTAPDARTVFQAQGATVTPTSPEEFTRFIRAENEKWARVIKATQARLE